MKKTLRLIFPEWQGGMNPLYAQGAEILSKIIPQGKNCKVIEVPVSKNYEDISKISLEVSNGEKILEQQQKAFEILEKENPDKILTIGGDCSVSQAPFDFLHGKYPKNTAIIWIDAHPDISEPKNCPNEHAMVLGNLLGDGAKKISKTIRNKFNPKQILYVGVVKEKMLDYEVEKNSEYKIPIITPEEIFKSNEKIINWIRENKIKNLLIHFDLDVLSPKDFYSLLCNEPHTPPVDYAVGKLTLAQVVKIITDISKVAEIVGLTISEFMCWDAFNIRKEFSKIDIFNN